MTRDEKRKQFWLHMINQISTMRRYREVVGLYKNLERLSDEPMWHDPKWIEEVKNALELRFKEINK